MNILQRLLWREYRESATYVIIGVTLPLLCLGFYNFRGDDVILPLLAIIIMLVVWGASRAQKNQGDVLPLSMPWRLTIRYLLPISCVMLVALAIGSLFSLRMKEAIHFDYIPFMLILCVSVYLLSVIISSIFSLFLSVLAGIVWIFMAFFITTDRFATEYIRPMLFLLFIVFVIALFWEGYRGKYRVLIGRISLLMLISLSFFWVVSKDSWMWHTLYRYPRLTDKFIPPLIHVGNGFDYDGMLSIDHHLLKSERIMLFDKHIPRSYFISPSRLAQKGEYVRSLACVDRHTVLFAVQAPKDANIRVIAWDASTGNVQERFRFIGIPGMISRYPYSTLSPDNRYLLLGVDSQLGSGIDFWLLDVQHNRATLVVPNAVGWIYNSDNQIPSEAIWASNRVILRLNTRCLAVDLQTLHVSQLQLGGAL